MDRVVFCLFLKGDLKLYRDRLTIIFPEAMQDYSGRESGAGGKEWALSNAWIQGDTCIQPIQSVILDVEGCIFSAPTGDCSST